MHGNGHLEQHEPNLFTPVAPSFVKTVDYSHLVKTLSAWRYVLNARLLALFALAGALAGFAFTMYDATPLRLWGLGIYSVLCLWPVMWLHLKKG